MRVLAWGRLILTCLQFISVKTVSGYYNDHYYYNEDYDEEDYPGLTDHLPKDYDIGADFEVFYRIF